MKKAIAEKTAVVILFVLVLVVFSFAQRDTKKQIEQHNAGVITDVEKRTPGYTASAEEQVRILPLSPAHN